MNTKNNGAGTAERALTTGEPLRDAAEATAQSVENELMQDGADSLARRGAIRLQAVADLYFNAMQGAENIDRLDQLVKRWGWIQNSALRAWAQVRADGKGKHDAARVIAAMREAANDKTE